jgi:hypothetical protein
MEGAPVSVSQDIQQYTRFKSQGTTIEMHTCAPITQILRASPSGALTNLRFGALDANDEAGVATQAQAMLLNPVSPAFVYDDDATLQPKIRLDANFISPVWDLIGSAFVRYRVKRLSFHYEPQSAATDTARLVFAFANDPAHPVLNQLALDQADLLAMSDSTAFMPWKSWSMDVTQRIDSKTLYYTHSIQDGAGADAEDRITANIAERFSDFGIIACLTDTEADGSGRAGGILYMETIISFEEFCPITTTPVSGVSTLMRKLVLAQERKIRRKTVTNKGEDKVDSDNSKKVVQFRRI